MSNNRKCEQDGRLLLGREYTPSYAYNFNTLECFSFRFKKNNLNFEDLEFQ